jgi:hypothetical protein
MYSDRHVLMSTEDPLPPDEQRRLYFEAIRLFNAGEFFAAHEAWEEIWTCATGDKQRFLQGLIQCAVALEHYRRGNPRGVVSLHRTYPRKFAGLPNIFMGLHVPNFLTKMEHVLAPVLELKTLPKNGVIQLDPDRLFTMTLEHDPFAAGV